MMLRLFFFLFLCVNVHAYLEENVISDLEFDQLVVSDGCSMYINKNGTNLLMHNQAQLINVTSLLKTEGAFTAYSTDISSQIAVVNNDCSLVVFGFPEKNRVALWRPFLDTVTNIVPADITEAPRNGESHAVFLKDYNVTGLDNVIRVNISNTVGRFGFSLDISGQTWVVGSPGEPTDNLGYGGTPGYAFVFDGNELHSCRTTLEMNCYPEGTLCVSGIDNWKNYYGKLKTIWSSTYIPMYGHLDYDLTNPNIDNSEVAMIQKLCLPLERPYTKALGPMLEEVYEEHRENYQQFGYSVAITGSVQTNNAMLVIGAPGDSSRFMEDNSGANYGRVYVYDMVVWPYDSGANSVSWWQPNVYSPYILPLELATYQAFGRNVAASNELLAISIYPLYEDTYNPFVLLYNCNGSWASQSNCEPIDGISIDNLPGNPLAYLSNADKGYLDGKTTWPYIPAPPFQNEYIGENVGVVGSNVIIADPENDRVYRLDFEGQLLETHNTLGVENQPISTAFASMSEHWVAQMGSTQFAHFWPCQLGYVGVKYVCDPAQTGYYSDDGWAEFQINCPRNYTTNETGQTSCIIYVPEPADGLTLESAILIGGILFGVVFCLFFVICVSQGHCPWLFTAPCACVTGSCGGLCSGLGNCFSSLTGNVASFCSCFPCCAKNYKPPAKIKAGELTFYNVFCCCCTTQTEEGNKEENVEFITNNLNTAEQIDF